MNSAALKATRWGMIFTLLSMDVMTPFYEPMGLAMPDKQRFLKMLRRLILENRTIYQQNPEVIPPLADHVLEEMQSILGVDETEHFFKWATTVYTEVPADHPQWSAWQIIFFRAAYNDKIQERLGVPAGKRDNILAQYFEVMDLTEVEQKIEKIKTQPLSDWDLEMYSIHQFSNDDLSDPFAIVLSTVEMNRFQLFWEQLLSQLSVDEKTHLWKQAQRILKETGIWLPEGEGLSFPDELRRQL
jgi:hypothetical protein